MKTAAQHIFVPFIHDHQVCDTCGKLATNHVTAIPEYRTAVWAFLIERGYVHSTYGGHDDYETSNVQEHMRGCEIDWNRTTDPEAGTLSEFTDTESPNADVSKFFGILYCACNKVRYREICIDDMTLGQIIWHVVKGA